MKTFKFNLDLKPVLWVWLLAPIMTCGLHAAPSDTPPTQTVTPDDKAAEEAKAREIEILRSQMFERRILQGRPNPPPKKALTETLPPGSTTAEKILAAGDQPGYLTGSTMLVESTANLAGSKDGKVSPSQNVTINLINRLVQRGVLPQEDANDLIKQAEADAETAKAQAAEKTVASGTGEIASNAVRVTYVPQSVKNQMSEEIRQDVMAQAREENWAAPNSVPEWVSRFTLFGDVRVRYEGNFFPSGNATGLGSNFFNYNSINTSSTPYDFTGLALPPYNNVDQDRNRARLRVRFGTEVDLTRGFSAGIRLATGESNSPVSPNQSLGAANNGQGGNFSKYAVWLDRSYIKYELGNKPDKKMSFSFGRFENPFFSTDMIYDDDLGFDGVAVSGKYQATEGVVPFATVGAFPVFNSDFNFSSNQPNKFKSQDKWMYAVQIGTDLKINDQITLKVAGAFYDFENIEGKVSTPYVPLTASDAGDTDNTRPSFAQKGNSYIALREIEPDPSNGFGTTNQWQYFGLATPYRLAAFTTRLDLNHFDPVHIWLVGETVVNTAFNENDINRNGPTTLRGPVNNLENGVFDGGDMGWTVRLNVGKVVLEKLWDWNASFGYRYVESDAVVDGLADSDFGGGGTNLEGFTLGANVAFSKYVFAGVRWLSADNIAGPNFKADVFQIDLNAKF